MEETKEPCIHCQKIMFNEWNKKYKEMSKSYNDISNNLTKQRKKLANKSIEEIINQTLDSNELKITEELKDKKINIDWETIRKHILVYINGFIQENIETKQIKLFMRYNDFIKKLTPKEQEKNLKKMRQQVLEGYLNALDVITIITIVKVMIRNVIMSHFDREGYERVDSFKLQEEELKKLTENDVIPSLVPITGGKKRKNRKSKKAKKSKKRKTNKRK